MMVVIHGIPGGLRDKHGDMFGRMRVILGGYHSGCVLTMAVGEVGNGPMGAFGWGRQPQEGVFYKGIRNRAVESLI